MTERVPSALLRHRMHALEQRMHGQDAAVRELLEARLQGLLASCNQQFAAVPEAKRCDAISSPLAILLQQWPHTSAPGDALTAAAVGQDAAPVIPLLEDARRTWRTVRARSQLRQSLAQPQEHAGPLNSGRLVLRMLDAMQAASPEYLECLLTYLDTLVALEPLVPAGAPSDAPVAPRRTTRARKRRD